VEWTAPHAECSDAALIAKLRDGETEAYTELWRRHINAALRLGRRLAPGRADDLASESFLAVYRQITESGNGPEEAFRAYLFTTMRNLAMRWSKADAIVLIEEDLDTVDEVDRLSTVEDRERAAAVLDAFQSLPPRWQRVLWLTEVDEMRRPDIAAELGIKPSAVTALYRRARQGLQLQWLTQLVPASLREHPEHVAGELPRLAIDRRLDPPAPEISAHLQHCAECAVVADELSGTHARMHGKTLVATGFVGLGVVLPAASQVPLTAAGTAAAAAALGGFGGLGGAGGIGSGIAVAAGISAILVGGLAIVNTVGAPGTAVSDATKSAADSTSGSRPWSSEAEIKVDAGLAGEGSTGDSGGAPSEAETSPSPASPIVGRGIADPALTTTTFGDTVEVLVREFPARPRPAPPGTAPMGSAVAIEFERRTTEGAGPGDPCSYSTQERHGIPVDASGQWAFDFRPLLASSACTYDYRVWAYTDEHVSPATTGAFRVTAPAVTGFESLDPFELLPLEEATTTGIVFRIDGPPNSAVCVTSVWTGQSETVVLDGAGIAVQRLLLESGGHYFLEFRGCEGGWFGPPTEILFGVEDPDGFGFGPFGPEPSTGEFTLADP